MKKKHQWTASEMGKKGIRARLKKSSAKQISEWCRHAGVASGKARAKKK